MSNYYNGANRTDNRYRRGYNRRGRDFHYRPYDNYRGRNNYNYQSSTRYSEHVEPRREENTRENDVEIFTNTRTPEEQKAHDFVNEVLNQSGVRGQLIFYMSENDNATNVIQSAADYFKLKIQVDGDATNGFKLNIGDETFGEGIFVNKQAAKQSLCKSALEELQKSCFTILKKNEYEDIQTSQDPEKKEEPSSSNMQNSKAYKMLLNMGWSGKGLGVNEQGEQKTVAEKMTENISRSGLGSGDIIGKVKDIINDFLKSDTLSTLRFEPDFTSEDREQIHKFAQRLGLKTKSVGKDPNRRLTVTKKLDRKMLVTQLLIKDCDSESYKLVIPPRFAYKWFDNDDESDDFT